MGAARIPVVVAANRGAIWRHPFRAAARNGICTASSRLAAPKPSLHYHHRLLDVVRHSEQPRYIENIQGIYTQEIL
ncbi:uncharacterized protein ARMOST_09769 [Armillaria ostoyae]|uniref:Uncharacterized protein n=1 Tax=Armillaria ostoyae TaxID=47428 RepID=A0A284RCF9_ARMOS|nr:uncharacterized protein ARMOST_09769 [Armillaria ostoyae]